MTKVLSPSDVKLPLAASAVVAGRVAFASREEVVLADALGTLRVTANWVTDLEAGDLVVLQLDAGGRDAQAVLSQVIEHRKCPEPRGDGEFARLTSGDRGSLLRARSHALAVVRRYFEEQAFIEVETPTFTMCPGLDPYVHSLAAVERGARRDFLITSPEFHMKRLLVGGMPRIYQVARCFRAEELGHRHQPEFTLLEWYRAFSDYHTILADTEEVVTRVFEALSADGEYVGGRIQHPFARLTVREAFAKFAGVSDAVQLHSDDPARFFELLTTVVEDGIASLGRPAFLTHYPLPLAALARRCPDDPTVAERFELYLGKTELSNGYGELTDAPEQRRRFEMERARRKAAGETVYPLDERLLAALSEGMPRSAGNALGFDRLVALASGQRDIARTLAFSDAER